MATFHVAPDGDDSAAGTLAAPFRTSERARNAVRSVKWAQTGDIVVLFRGGTYYVPRQVLLDQNDSGINGHRVIYRNYPGERPVFVGGLPVSAWEREDDNVYRTTVPGLREGLVPLTQLFEGERRAWPARHPNDGYLEAESRARTAITYKPGDLDPQAWDLSQAQARFYEPYYWFTTVLPITAVDPDARRLALADRTFYAPDEAPFLYTVQNVRALLDSPGEFYADRKTGLLHYWPHQTPIEAQPIVYDTTECVLRFAAYSTHQPVHDITLEGLEFRVSSSPTNYRFGWPERGELGTPDNETDRFTNAAEHNWGLIALENARAIRLKDCIIRDTGANAVSLLQWCQGNELSGCLIAHCGFKGVLIRGDVPPEGTDHSQGNVIDNCYIHHVGEVLRHGSCIRVFHSAKNQVTHCLLTDAPRCGVYVGSQWDTPRDRQLTYGNVIARNRVFRCMNATCDGGAIYLAATNNREDSSNVVDSNLVVDTYNSLPGWASTPIYTDLQADYTVVKDNLVCDYQAAPVVGAGSRIETNNSWNDGFDLAKVQQDFGLTAAFTYPFPAEEFTVPGPPVPMELPFATSFEGECEPLRMMPNCGWRVPFSDQVAHSGAKSVVCDRTMMALRYTHPQPFRGQVTVWLYDDAAKQDAYFVFLLRKWAVPDDAEHILGLGVCSKNEGDPTRYCIRLGGNHMATSTVRVTGWHELGLDLRSQAAVRLTLDGQQVYETAEWMELDTIQMGGWGGDSRGLAFDDLSVTAD